MFLNDSVAKAASKNYTGFFYSELENNPAPAWLALVFTVILTSFFTEIIGFTKGFPQMREWLGERRIQSLSEYSVQISKKDWELTVAVQRDDMMRDRFGIIANQIRGLASAVPQHYIYDFFVNLCLNGFSTLSYDGANFFDANHPNGGGTVYSNTTANKFSATEYATAKTSAAKIKNADNKKSLAIRYSHLFYGANAEVDVQTVFGLQFLGNGTTMSNPYYNVIPESNRIMVPELGDTAKWYLFDLTKTLKPFALMLVKGVDFIPFDSPQDWNVFSKKEYVYGIDTIDNATYLLPELAYGSSVA